MLTGTQEFTTGIEALDKVLSGLRRGDNIVWQVESIDHYRLFVDRFVAAVRKQDRPLLYFRFARHEPILPVDDKAIRVVHLEPQAGFETFLDGIRTAALEAGPGAAHVFDSLSDLTADWYCDQMVGNFFELTCPYLYELETVAYFALLKDFHSAFAINPVTETTQLLLDVYHHKGACYVQALKVEGRTSPRMYTLHRWEGEDVVPITDSSLTSEVLMASPRAALGLAGYRLGVWTRTFVEAEGLLQEHRLGRAAPEAINDMFHRLLRMAISRDERVLGLAERYFDLADLVTVGKRMLGTGLIGGKSVGMLLAQAILRKTDPRWNELLEVHDSFYIPSDVFYTFLVRNDCWEVRKRQLDAADYGEGAEEARRLILAGDFPDHIKKRFEEMLDYFGQSPIIVRSSSLLEDNFGNSFAGKYDSVFCVNQGTRERRLRNFIAAVKHVYASTMSKKALAYRDRHGLLHRDEQMALLVQRVSGAQHGQYYFPQVAGVGFSFNPYVWDPNIDPEAGMLRIVFGMGTRAVDRSDDDYTRLVALNAPDRRPGLEAADNPRHAQHKVDVLDLERNAFVTTSFKNVAGQVEGAPMELFTSRDRVLEREARDRGRNQPTPRVLTFDRLIRDGNFVSDMTQMLRILEDAYAYPVDVEFTANFDPEGNYRIGIVQCRPLQVKGGSGIIIDLPEETRPEDLVLETKGPVIGQSRIDVISRIVYVRPEAYANLPEQKRHAVARLIGRLNTMTAADDGATLLLGPGRWGTTTPSLGVPVSFAEINRISVICEIVAMRDDLVPDVSFGTHFFSELVEVDMLYLALFPNHKGNVLNRAFLENSPNKLRSLLPDTESLEDIVRVIELSRWGHEKTLRIYADVLNQTAVCRLEE